MKYVKAYRVYFFLSVIMIGSYVVHCVFSNTMCDPQGCFIDIEGMPSESMRASTISYLMHQWQVAGTCYDQLCEQVMGRFKWIQSIDITRMPYGKTCVAIVGHKPLYIINDDHVITNAGMLLQKDDFDAVLTSRLRSFSVLFDGEMILSDACKQFVRHVAPSLFDFYECVWENDNTIRLKDKQNALFTILCRPDAIPDDGIIKYCNALKQEVMSRAITKSQRTKAWIADTRFQGQIVLSQEHKGGTYGTNV